MEKDRHPGIISRRTLLQAAALSPLLALVPGLVLASPAQGFTHSVASGDPLQDSVTLWTRYVPAEGGMAELAVEIALDAAFTKMVARAVAFAGPETDFWAKLRQGGLQPGQWYHYRFIAPDGTASDTGRTRTLPSGPLDIFRIGVFSCANATSGWFNAYGHAAARDDLDLIVHLGDYIYESKLTRSDALKELAIARNIQPQHEIVSLLDYRLRYASYRMDKDLQALHRNYPMIVMCDDHETVNNSWQHGAENHGADEGSWDDRMGAAMRAWHEWMPMRPDPYSQYQLGDLATLFRLETRILGRTQQLDLGAWLKGKPDLQAAAIAFRDDMLADPARTMMGQQQEDWLAKGLAASTGAGTRWQILAQQVIMGTTIMPQDYASWFRPGDAPDAAKKAELDVAVMLGRQGIPTSMDRWDGYPAARARLLAASQAAGADLVVLSGDSHNAWAFNLQQDDGTPAGVEFAGHSVSSLGMDKRYFGDPAAIAASYLATNSNLQWCDTSRRGYMVVNITPDVITNEWLFLHSRDRRSLELLDTHKMQVHKDARTLSAA